VVGCIFLGLPVATRWSRCSKNALASFTTVIPTPRPLPPPAAPVMRATTSRTRSVPSASMTALRRAHSSGTRSWGVLAGGGEAGLAPVPDRVALGGGGEGGQEVDGAAVIGAGVIEFAVGAGLGGGGRIHYTNSLYRPLSAFKLSEKPGDFDDGTHGLKIHVSPVRSRLCPLPSGQLNNAGKQAEKPVFPRAHPARTNGPRVAYEALTEAAFHYPAHYTARRTGGGHA
jgi:hypothetical protein